MFEGHVQYGILQNERKALSFFTFCCIMTTNIVIFGIIQHKVAHNCEEDIVLIFKSNLLIWFFKEFEWNHW